MAALQLAIFSRWSKDRDTTVLVSQSHLVIAHLRDSGRYAIASGGATRSRASIIYIIRFIYVVFSTVEANHSRRLKTNANQNQNEPDQNRKHKLTESQTTTLFTTTCKQAQMTSFSSVETLTDIQDKRARLPLVLMTPYLRELTTSKSKTTVN